VYPLMEGGSLEDRLIRTAAGAARFAALGVSAAPPLPWAARLSVMEEVLTAVLYLHTPATDLGAASKGVELHLDIKPSNILLDREGRARLADLGLAHGVEEGQSHHSLSSVVGTTGYIDPLLNESQQATPANDGYAIGVTLLQCLVGLPVQGLKPRCRQLLERPDEPGLWTAPGCPDATAGEWPVLVARSVAQIVHGLIMPQFEDQRLPIEQALQQLRGAPGGAGAARGGGVGGGWGGGDPGGGNSEGAAIGAGGSLFRDADPASGGAAASAPVPAAARYCIICESQPREVRFGCGHACYCHDCWARACCYDRDRGREQTACPTCGVPVARLAELGAHVNAQPSFVQQRRPPAAAPADSERRGA